MTLVSSSLTFLSCFILTVLPMPFYIHYLQEKKRGQVIREDGPTWHNSKTGTPTMGGAVFLLAIIVSSIGMGVMQKLLTPSLILLLFILLLYGILGFLDDFIKVFKKRNMGLTSLQKLIGQLLGGYIFFLVYHTEGFGNSLYIPFIGEVNLGWFFALFILFWLVGFSNAVNLTDGIDGLVSGLGIISFGTYAIIAFYQEQFDVLLFCIAVVGGLVGFFIYNKKPAKIFMGDVGSLALGGALAAVSILLQQEWTLLLIGLIYVCETGSVILQVASFKLTGKRIFKMSPIHHHFEMCGWSEWRIDITFWLVSLVLSIITLFIVL